jgi:hypothetical protein
MLMITAFIAMLKGYWPDGDLPYFAEPLFSEATVATLAEPESVTVRVAYPAEDDYDVFVARLGLRTVGEARPLDRRKWAAGWKQVSGITRRQAQSRPLCPFHPDRLVTLRRDGHIVRVVTCHTCMEIRIASLDRDAYLPAPLVPALDRRLLDTVLEPEWLDLAALEEGLGRETVAILQSRPSLKAAQVEPGQFGLVATASAEAALARGAVPVRSGMTDRILDSAAENVRLSPLAPDADREPQEPQVTPWALVIDARAKDGRRVLVALVRGTYGRWVIQLVRNEPEERYPGMSVSTVAAQRLLDSVGMKPPGP